MLHGLSERPPTIGETQTRMQRVRVGVTGLAVVVLVVTLATAISSGVARRANEGSVAAGNAAVATAPAANAAVEKTEPLAELGVAPAPKEVAPPAPTPPAKPTR